ncbi:MAG: patatin-like phospholipase family protein [Spirochaetaceae bacterium]|jgi:NTE family protein|nr:patatin-like phospholipase family protein [Spirochaetaceae bacterium]
MNKGWALVLSGGGAKGLAHIGVLRGLMDRGFPPPSLVVGTSMGAIVGGLYACGMHPKEMARFVAEEFDLAKHLDGFAFKINGPVGLIFQTGQIVGNLAVKTGIDSGQGLLRLFEELTGGKTFEETAIPFRCNAVDMVSGEETVFKTGPVARAMRASMSFPGFFAPLIDGGRCFMDGGLADNMPVWIARSEGFKQVLAVDVVAFQTARLSSLKTGVQIIYRSMEIALKSMTVKSKRQAALTLRASDSRASPLNFARKKEFIALGEEAVNVSHEPLSAFFSRRIGSGIPWKRPRECGIILPPAQPEAVSTAQGTAGRV